MSSPPCPPKSASSDTTSNQPRDWFVSVGPYVTLIVKALQLVVPVGASVAGVLLTSEQLQQAQNELQPMTTLVAALPAQSAEASPVVREQPSQLTPAQGQAARMIRILLFKLDPGRAFGDLRRVQAPSGEFLWVCPDHYPQYDPGLPTV
jgi:hypothetical protein